MACLCGKTIVMFINQSFQSSFLRRDESTQPLCACANMALLLMPQSVEQLIVVMSNYQTFTRHVLLLFTNTLHLFLLQYVASLIRGV